MARELSEDKSRNIISSGGFCYSGVSPMMNQIQGFEGNPSEIFSLTTGMEMIGFSNDLQQHTNKPGNNPGPSSSTTSDHFYQHDQFAKQDFTTGMSEKSGETENLINAAGAWQILENNNSRLLVDDSSLRCVFPCEGNERPSQGLSLSLSSSNPSSIGLQSFQLGQINHDQEDGFFGNPASVHQQQQQNGQFQMRNSKYLVPAQELLNEFCSLGTKQNDATNLKSNKQWDDENASNSSRNQPLYSLEFMELQKRKTKLLSMLEEVDRRYRHYCDQMKAVVSSFEVVTGNGAATVYSALATKAMSRHFRCLREGIVRQIQATKKAMGEKDVIAPGTSKGETPRLKIIDQALRQQRAFQQMTMMESHPWRTQRGLPEKSVSVLRAWLFEHFLHPYPTDVDKHVLSRQTGLSGSQVSNWFINARVRLWKPMVEEMYLEETKEQDDDNMALSSVQIQNPPAHDQKPPQSQLVRIDSECLSSIINNHDNNEIANKTPKALHHQNHHLHQSLEAMELDFSSYNQQTMGGVSYANNDHQNFNGGDVSLTLGLQQQGGSGVSLAFSPPSQSSLFYPRDHIEECQPIHYSLFDCD